jgi:hypothetical protein
MITTELVSFFAWCTLINYTVLLIWFVVFSLGHDWLHLMHGKWFDLDQQQFDLANYFGLGLFKLCILIFNVAPYIALRIIE